jgi:hypothetical protein
VAAAARPSKSRGAMTSPAEAAAAVRSRLRRFMAIMAGSLMPAGDRKWNSTRHADCAGPYTSGTQVFTHNPLPDLRPPVPSVSPFTDTARGATVPFGKNRIIRNGRWRLSNPAQ